MGEMVSAGFRFIYFSDTSSIHMSHFFRSNDFCHLVSGGVFSHEVGAKKPEAKMYETFERDYGKPWLYIDDRQCNIDAALERGWNARRFTSPDTLRSALDEKTL